MWQPEPGWQLLRRGQGDATLWLVEESTGHAVVKRLSARRRVIRPT